MCVQTQATSMQCSQKLVVTLAIDASTNLQTSQLQFSVPCVNRCPKHCCLCQIIWQAPFWALAFRQHMQSCAHTVLCARRPAAVKPLQHCFCMQRMSQHCCIQHTCHSHWSAHTPVLTALQHHRPALQALDDMISMDAYSAASTLHKQPAWIQHSCSYLCSPVADCEHSHCLQLAT